MPDIAVRFVTDTKALEDVNKKLVDTGKITKEQAAAFRELGKVWGTELKAEMDKLGVSVQKTTTTSNEGFKSLRQRIKEARIEMEGFSDKQSEGAVAAQKKVAKLTDELENLNKRVAALNPGAKFAAFQQVAQGALGGIQALTGAMQVFGVKNEEVRKVAEAFQGALNVATGINSILSLKDALGNLKVVLGITTVAQESLAAATAAEATAMEAGAVANTAFAATLTATGIGALVVGLGLLLGAIYAVTQGQFDAADATRKHNDEIKAQIEYANILADGYKDVLEASKKQQTDDLEIAKLRGKSELEILNIQMNQLQNNKDILLEISKTKDVSSDLIDINNKILITSLKIDEAIKKSNEANKRGSRQAKIDVFLPTPDEIATRLEELKVPLKRGALEYFAELEKIRKENAPATSLLGDFFKTEDAKKAAELDAIRENANATIDIVGASFAAISDISKAETENRISELTKQKESGVLTEEEYQKQVKVIRQRAAEDQKKAMIFQATMQFAAALVNALTFTPAAAVPAALITAATVGGINLAKIIATPIPKFNKGTLSVGGVDMGHDSVMAMLRPGEAVIPTEINRAYHPSVEAIYKRMISPAELNGFVKSRTSGTKSVKAHINPYDLKYAMKGMPFVVANAGEIGRAVAAEMGGTSRIQQKRLT